MEKSYLFYTTNNTVTTNLSFISDSRWKCQDGRFEPQRAGDVLRGERATSDVHVRNVVRQGCLPRREFHGPNVFQFWHPGGAAVGGVSEVRAASRIVPESKRRSSARVSIDYLLFYNCWKINGGCRVLFSNSQGEGLISPEIYGYSSSCQTTNRRLIIYRITDK